MKRKALLIFTFALVFFINAKAQSSNNYMRNLLDTAYSAKKAAEPIKVDGILNERIWQNSQKSSPFVQNFPSDTLLGTARTEVMITYDDKFFYVAAKAYNSKKNQKYIVPSLKRDFRGKQMMPS